MRVQEVAARGPSLPGAPYSVSPDHRVPDAREVHADLVRPAGPDPHFEQRERRRSAAGRDTPTTRRGPPSSRAVMRVRRTGSRAIGRSMRPRLLLHRPVHQRQIHLLHLPPGELRRQRAGARRRSSPPAARRW